MKGSAAMAEVVEPYAEALMSLAQAHDLADRFGQDAAGVLSTLEASPELSAFLGSPIHAGAQKKAVLNQIFGNEVHSYVMNFLMLLVDRQRIPFLSGICKRYRELLRTLKQIALAEVTSAVELNDEQRQSVVNRVKAMMNVEAVELETRVDPELIGGVVIKVGSQVVDASLRGQLRRLAVDLSRA